MTEAKPWERLPRVLVVAHPYFQESFDIGADYEQIVAGRVESIELATMPYVATGWYGWESWNRNIYKNGSIGSQEFVAAFGGPQEVTKLDVGTEFDCVVMSSHWPVKIADRGITEGMVRGDKGYAKAKEILNRCPGGVCSFDYFVSHYWFGGKPVFRLDGRTSADIEDWLQALQDGPPQGERKLVFDCDSGLGAAWEPYDKRFLEAYEAAANRGLPALLDRSPEPVQLGSGQYGAYLGWYDKLPEEFFSEGEWRGAIGWQLRSGTYRDRERNWVTAMLEAGFFFTIGSCVEPYASAYPDPVEFVEMALEGKASMPAGLAAWWLATDRRTLVFIGDPTYVCTPSEKGSNAQPQPSAAAQTLLHAFRLEDGNELQIVKVRTG